MNSFENISNDYLLDLIDKYGEGVSLDYKEESYVVSMIPEDNKYSSGLKIAFGHLMNLQMKKLKKQSGCLTNFIMREKT